MSRTSNDKKKLKNGVLGSYSGEIEGIIFQKNGVIRSKPTKAKRKKRE